MSKPIGIIGAGKAPSTLAMIMAIQAGRKSKPESVSMVRDGVSLEYSRHNIDNIVKTEQVLKDFKKASKKVKKAKAKKTGFVKTGKK